MKTHYQILFLFLSLNALYSQNHEGTIKSLEDKLKSNKVTLTQILTDETLTALHHETAFMKLLS